MVPPPKPRPAPTVAVAVAYGPRAASTLALVGFGPRAYGLPVWASTPAPDDTMVPPTRASATATFARRRRARRTETSTFDPSQRVFDVDRHVPTRCSPSRAPPVTGRTLTD